jgi:hypothetical protein
MQESMQMLMRGREQSGNDDELDAKTVVPESWGQNDGFISGDQKFDFSKSVILN